MSDYESQFKQECKMCGVSFKCFKHEPFSDFCVNCRGKRWQSMEDRQMAALLEINENIKRLVLAMEGKRK